LANAEAHCLLPFLPSLHLCLDFSAVPPCVQLKGFKISHSRRRSSPGNACGPQRLARARRVASYHALAALSLSEVSSGIRSPMVFAHPENARLKDQHSFGKQSGAVRSTSIARSLNPHLNTCEERGPTTTLRLPRASPLCRAAAKQGVATREKAGSKRSSGSQSKTIAACIVPWLSAQNFWRV